MEIDEYLKYRADLLNESKDEDGFITESSFLNSVMPSMLEAKRVDSEDYNESYYIYIPEKIKINGYSVNESGERLQLFIVNEESINLGGDESNLLVSLKTYYENQFMRAVRFIQIAHKGQITEGIQDSDGIKALLSQITSQEGLDQYDVIEIFLISATATIETRGASPQPKTMEFENEKLKVQYKKNREHTSKELVIIKKLIDLNFLYNVLISQGNREPLKVDFEKLFNFKIEAIKAADEKYFESYLCVLPGNIISDMYKEYSSRMLEKNVRSFLQFPRKGVNSGMKDTIHDSPEKFIAYNNGLTITATGKEIEEHDGRFFIKSLTDFQIVNGGQTTATIYFSQKEGIPVSNVKVMAKINVAKNASEEELDELITKISTYSNAQSRVSKVDLNSRNSQLIKLKALSDSVVTPKGLKWFFERAKGELSTLIRKSGSGKKESVNKKFPKERRFTKEELAKYYTSWGDQPFLVKKGGEKVFRSFIEEISGEGTRKKTPEINRDFYENVIARIILFRSLEKIYGEGKKSIGQLRAAVIPYSLSVLFKCTDGEKDGNIFDLTKIWLNERLEQDLSDYFYELMKLMNNLIKKYATSDDPSENSKTKELWDSISESREVISFMKSQDTSHILKKYTITREELKKRVLKNSKISEVNFKIIQDNVSIHSNGLPFYQKIISLFHRLSIVDKEKLETITTAIFKRKDIDQPHIDYERAFINRVIAESPEIFDQIEFKADTSLSDTLDYIITIYNSAISQQDDVASRFNKIMELGKSKNIKDYPVWGEIGKLLVNGDAPKMKDIIAASSLITETKFDPDSKKQEIQKIDTSLLTKMVEWDSRKKVLSNNERQYLAGFAYGLNKLNDFHESNARRHLQTLLQAGFKVKK
jgi:hypothetical protein